jgi:hypothetical protein
MLKKMCLAAAASLILAGAALTAPVPASATSCKEAAKMQYPDDRKTRRAYHKECKQAWKLSVGKTGLRGKLKSQG